MLTGSEEEDAVGLATERDFRDLNVGAGLVPGWSPPGWPRGEMSEEEGCMALVETLAVKLGSTLGKLLLKSYLRDPAEAIGDDLLEIAKARIESFLDRKEAARQFERIGERIAVQLEPLLEREFRSDPVSVEAVLRELAETLNGRISAAFFLGQNLDPAKLQAEMKVENPLPRRSCGGCSNGRRARKNSLRDGVVSYSPSKGAPQRF